MVKNCSNCAHSRPRTPLPTIKELWEQDTRPVPPAGFLGACKALLFPNRYKRALPYMESDFADLAVIDCMEYGARKNIVNCHALPKPRPVNKDYRCMYYEEIPTID